MSAIISGFVDEMTSHVSRSKINRVTLKRLEVQAGLGAAALAAKLSGDQISFDYDSHSTVVCQKTFST